MNAGPIGIRLESKRMRRGMPISAAMLQRLADNDRTLAGKIAGRAMPIAVKRPVRFQVSFNTTEKRIYVAIGTVATTPDPEDKLIRPMMPTINGEPLDAEEQPYIEYGDFETGEHEIVVSFNNERAQIQVWKDGEIVAGQEGGSGEEENNDDEEPLVIATVNFSDESGEITPMDLKQKWASDVFHRMEEDSSSSGSSGGSSGDSSEESSAPSEPSEPSGPPSDESGEDKSTAVVPAYWTKGGFTALFCVESPEVRFTDILTTGLPKRVTRLRIDARFLAVCEPGSIQVVSAIPAQPMRIGAAVDGEFVILTRSIWSGPCPTTVYLSGIRKGFKGRRFPNRTREEFEANERFHKMSKPRR